MKKRMIGISLIAITLLSVAVLKIIPEYEPSLAVYGLQIAGLYFGVMLSLNAFDRKHLKT